MTWMISVKKSDLSLVDMLWGISFCIQTAIYYSKSLDYSFFHIFTPDRFSWEKVTFSFLVFTHGLRLSAYLMLRDATTDGEDKRWKKLRGRIGKNFWWVSFFYVFMPALLVNIIMGTTIYEFENSSKASINHLQYWIGILTMIAGGLFGSLADIQKYQFQNISSNKGKLLNTGLWSLCRHPNYFGETLFWWGTFIVNFAAGTVWTIICPLAFTFMIVYVTGIPAAEAQSREDFGSKYEEYVKNVAKFIPISLSKIVGKKNKLEQSPEQTPEKSHDRKPERIGRTQENTLKQE